MAVQPPRPFRLDQAHVHGVADGTRGRRAPADLVGPQFAVHRTQAAARSSSPPAATGSHGPHPVDSNTLNPSMSRPSTKSRKSSGPTAAAFWGAGCKLPTGRPDPIPGGIPGSARSLPWRLPGRGAAGNRWMRVPLESPYPRSALSDTAFLTISSCCRRSNTSGEDEGRANRSVDPPRVVGTGIGVPEIPEYVAAYGRATRDRGRFRRARPMRQPGPLCRMRPRPSLRRALGRAPEPSAGETAPPYDATQRWRLPTSRPSRPVPDRRVEGRGIRVRSSHRKSPTTLDAGCRGRLAGFRLREFRVALRERSISRAADEGVVLSQALNGIPGTWPGRKDRCSVANMNRPSTLKEIDPRVLAGQMILSPPTPIRTP